MNIEIDDEIADAVVKQSLTDLYKYTQESLKELNEVDIENGGLQVYQKQDYTTYASLRNACLTLLKHYMKPSEWKAL